MMISIKPVIKEMKLLAQEFIKEYKKNPRNIKLLSIDLDKISILLSVENEQRDILSNLYWKIIDDSKVLNSNAIDLLRNNENELLKK